MTNAPLTPIEINYRMRRGDYAALCKVLTSASPGRLVLLLVIVTAAIIAGAFAGANGDPQGAWTVLITIAELGAPVWLYVLLLVVLAVIIFGRPYVMALQGAVTYKRNAVADKDLRLRFNSGGINVESTNMQSHFGWSTIKRIIETDRYLFLAVSRREAMIVPRRAFANAADYERLKAFAETQLAES